MARLQSSALLVSSCVVGLSLAAPAAADDDRRIRAKLSGYNEDPLTISSPASANFRGKVDKRAQTIEYTLSYEGFVNTVQQAHIHFGGQHQSGGISVFLCTNLGNGPAGTQACPASPATISGTIVPANIIGPAGQGIAAGEFNELIDAIEAGVTYVNIHTNVFPGGEIRSQIKD